MAPSVLVILRSAVVDRVSVSVAVLFPLAASMPPGTVAVTVFVNEPVAEGEIAALTVYVTVEPLAMFTVSLIEPVPDGLPHNDPEAAEHVQLTPVSATGIVSAITTELATDGPALLATIV